MRIRPGFRILLTLWAVVTVAAVLAFAYSQILLYEDTRRNDQVVRIVDEGTQLVQLSYEVLFYSEPRAVEQWYRQSDDVGRAMAAVAEADDPHLRRTVGVLAQRFRQLRPMLERLIAQRSVGKESPATSILASQLFQDAIKLQASLRDLKSYSDHLLQAAYDTSKQRQLLLFGLFAGFIVVYGVVASGLFQRAVLRPLDRLGQTIHALREGQPARAEIQASDEIGEVCVMFNALLDEQEAASRKAQEFAERFRNVFEQAAVGMSILSPKGEWLEVNQCLCDIMGYSREEMLQATYQNYSPPDRAAADKARVKRLLAGEASHDSWDTVYLRGDGSELMARVTTALARDPQGQPLYFVTVTEDVTERRRAEEKIREINRQLEEQARVLQRANADLESYAWVASHDLREPLRMVTTYVGLIERRLGPDIGADMKDFIGFAIEGAKRMDRLIHSLLDYARIGHSEADLEPVDLGPVIKDCLRSLAASLAEANASVQVETPLPRVRGVRDDLERLFLNLIANAVKYRDPARPPEIRVSARQTAPEWWTVSVADNGIGIEPQYHDRVFGIFQRLHPRSAYEGTGIGLAQCKKIVERLGGGIRIDSDLGQGATFHVTLPAAPAEDSPEEDQAGLRTSPSQYS